MDSIPKDGPWSHSDSNKSIAQTFYFVKSKYSNSKNFNKICAERRNQRKKQAPVQKSEKGLRRDNSRAEALFLCAVSVHFTMPTPIRVTFMTLLRRRRVPRGWRSYLFPPVYSQGYKSRYPRPHPQFPTYGGAPSLPRPQRPP